MSRAERGRGRGRKLGVAGLFLAVLWGVVALWWWALVGMSPNVGIATAITVWVVGGIAGFFAQGLHE